MWTGGPWVADTSAWARASEPSVATAWKEAVRAGELIGCPIVTLERLRRSRPRGDRGGRPLVALPQAPITRTITDAGIWAMRRLANRGGGRMASRPSAGCLDRGGRVGAGLRRPALRPALRPPRDRPAVRQPMGRAAGSHRVAQLRRAQCSTGAQLEVLPPSSTLVTVRGT